MVCALLDFVCAKAVLVIYDCVMGGTHSPLQACMSLEIEVEAETFGCDVRNISDKNDIELTLL